MTHFPVPSTQKSARYAKNLTRKLQPIHLSLFTIFVLLLTTPRGDNGPKGLFRSSFFTTRDPHSYRVRRRDYFPTPFARVCSAEARAHFISRFDRPGRPLYPQSPPSLSASRNRVFLSSLPVEVGDGLGHRTCLLNFELFLAKALNLTYSHRNSTYGSLTRVDRNSVERLFGWGHDELPRNQVLENGCEEVGTQVDACEIPTDGVFCQRIRLRRDGGLFDQTVLIPDELAACFLQRAPGLDVEAACAAPVRAFLATFPEDNTLFQLTPGRCFHHWLYTNFSRTADWFGAKYWREDAGRVAERTRSASVEPRRVQIAMHVRRGDFFNYTQRVLVGDATYADVALRVKTAMDDMIGADVPVSVHVFSEGVAVGGRLKDNHDTETMRSVYVDEEGREREDGYWERLLRGHPRRRGRDIEVKMHIASDTVRAVHDMLAADVFVGSISGLSMQVARHLGRGIIALPLHESEVEPGEKVVPFDYGRNAVDSFLNETLLYERVGEYVRRNRIGCAVW